MTNWHESPLMIVKSADPTKLGGSAMGISIKDATRALLTASPISGDCILDRKSLLLSLPLFSIRAFCAPPSGMLLGIAEAQTFFISINVRLENNRSSFT